MLIKFWEKNLPGTCLFQPPLLFKFERFSTHPCHLFSEKISSFMCILFLLTPFPTPGTLMQNYHPLRGPQLGKIPPVPIINFYPKVHPPAYSIHPYYCSLGFFLPTPIIPAAQSPSIQNSRVLILILSSLNLL